MNASELEFAAQVHYSFLPDGYQDAYLDVSVKHLAHTGLGGDFCSVYPVDDDRIVICMCDAAGHGIAAALFAARINTFVLSHSIHSKCPCDLIEHMNAFFCQHMPDTTMLSTFFSLALDTRSGELAYAGAGHPPVLHFDAARQQVNRLASSTTLVGIQDPLPVACEVNKIQTGAGDRLLLYTDGLPESRAPDGSFYGSERLAETLSDDCGCGAERMNQHLIDDVLQFTAGKPGDDILSMAISLR